MYDIDKQFFNEDGTVNCEAAGKAGRKARGKCAANARFPSWRPASSPVRLRLGETFMQVARMASFQWMWRTH